MQMLMKVIILNVFHNLGSYYREDAI